MRKKCPTKKGAVMTLDPRYQADMPTSGINIRTLSSSHPVYLAIPGSGCRSAQGTPAKDRARIGEMNPVAGKLLPNFNYWSSCGLDESARAAPVCEPARTIGGAFLAGAVVGRLGLVEILDEALGVERAKLVRTAALRMIARGNVLGSLPDYCEANNFRDSPLTPQAASRLFATIACGERMAFQAAGVTSAFRCLPGLWRGLVLDIR
jgi:hypothetical protein